MLTRSGGVSDRSQQAGSPNRFGFAEHLIEVFIRIQRFGISPECICSGVENILEMDF